MLIDSHTHIHFPAYDSDREAVLKRAKDAGVKMICVGTQASTSEAAIRLAEQNPDDVWATVGFHPNHLGEHWHHDTKEQESAEQEQFNIAKLRELAQHPKAVAIGECGLDYYRLGANREAQIEKQKEVLSAQVKLAEELGKPLMIHCRPTRGTNDAYENLLTMFVGVKVPRVAHFYVGGSEATAKLVEAGFYFTFGGVITFARDYDESIKLIPLDRILLETDAPYVAPEPYRGRRNEPAYVVETAKKLAELKDVSFEEVAEQTTANALTIFRIAV